MRGLAQGPHSGGTTYLLLHGWAGSRPDSFETGIWVQGGIGNLSAGLASSAYIGIDTGDAGLANWIRLERDNAPLLAASYWVNDRLYHREVCDMSVGTKASVEEARFKLSLMTLSGCSISFSDSTDPLQSV